MLTSFCFSRPPHHASVAKLDIGGGGGGAGGKKKFCKCSAVGLYVRIIVLKHSHVDKVQG